jgi:hypothetical protein
MSFAAQLIPDPRDPARQVLEVISQVPGARTQMVVTRSDDGVTLLGWADAPTPNGVPVSAEHDSAVAQLAAMLEAAIGTGVTGPPTRP